MLAQKIQRSMFRGNTYFAAMSVRLKQNRKRIGFLTQPSRSLCLLILTSLNQEGMNNDLLALLK